MKKFQPKDERAPEGISDYYVDAVRTRYLNKQIEKKHEQANPIQYRNI